MSRGPYKFDVVKKSLTRPKQEVYNEEQERISCKEFIEPIVPKYDYQRRTLLPLDFAKYVLNDHGMLHLHHGHLWLDGQYATLARIVDYADAILIAMKLPPVGLGKKR